MEIDTLAELRENLTNKMDPHYSRCWKWFVLLHVLSWNLHKNLHSWIKIPFATGPEQKIPVFHGQQLRRMYIPIYTFHPVSLE
jgi:hypothetical protein